MLSERKHCKKKKSIAFEGQLLWDGNSAAVDISTADSQFVYWRFIIMYFHFNAYSRVEKKTHHSFSKAQFSSSLGQNIQKWLCRLLILLEQISVVSQLTQLTACSSDRSRSQLTWDLLFGQRNLLLYSWKGLNPEYFPLQQGSVIQSRSAKLHWELRDNRILHTLGNVAC